MKTTIFSIMFAMMLGMVLSCGNSAKTEATDTTAVDSDTVMVDTLAVDSLVAE